MLDRFSALSKDLAVEMDAAHAKGGNPGYPARQMLRLHVLRFLMNERYANHFLNRVDNDPRLLELCSLSRTPSERAFSDFKNHKMEPFKWELHLTAAAFVEECADEIEYLKGGKSASYRPTPRALGEILAIDATDIPAYARPRGEHCDPPGEGNCKKKHRTHCDSPDPDQCTKHKSCADPGAAWGYRTPKGRSPQAESGKKEYFFGYDADVITDAYCGLPLYVNVRPANLNEGPRMRADLDACLKLHPWLKPKYLAADKGYHALYNFRHVADLDIAPIIAIPMPPKDGKGKRLHEGLYTEKGLPVCIGGRAMEFVETREDGAHRFRCPPEGCHLKDRTDWSRYCDFDYSEKPEGTRLRIMGTVHRASGEWKEIFKKRPSIERYFSSGKQSRLLDKHQYIGLQRVSLHVKLSVLSHLLTAWGRLRAGDYDKMRRMTIRLPRATRQQSLPLEQTPPVAEQTPRR